MLCLSTLILFHFTSDQALEHLHLHRIVHRDVKDEIGRDLGTVYTEKWAKALSPEKYLDKMG